VNGVFGGHSGVDDSDIGSWRNRVKVHSFIRHCRGSGLSG
jgi:hypothetical protein